MATKEFPLTPQEVAPVKSDYRTIQTAIPTPESVSILEEMRAAEPRSMGGQPPVIWDGGDHSTVHDRWGNRWIDFSAGVLVTSSGHAHPKIIQAMRDMLDQGLYHAYCFPTEIRAQLVRRIVSLLPKPLARVFLLTTGSESTECAIKLCRTMGLKRGGEKKRIMVSFDNAFHGRTMASQLAGGSPGLKEWLGGASPDFVQAPFPDGYRCEDTSFDVFEKALADQGVDPDDVCGVITETYQGCNACIMPKEYGQALRAWCDTHGALFVCDEVQAGFGRCGTWFGFQHMGIVPDLACFGKGVSGGMPLSVVAGTEEAMSLYGPGEMTSTHSANPICSAAAMANIDVIDQEGLVEKAARLHTVIMDACRAMEESANGHVGRLDGVGMVAAMQFVVPGSKDIAPDTAWAIVKKSVERGLMLFAPVGVGGSAIKINPPLTIEEAALNEGLEVLAEVVGEVCR